MVLTRRFCSFGSLPRLFPTASISDALRLSDFSKTVLVVLRVFFDSPLDLVEELAVKGLLGNSVAEVEHCICFAPVLTILPKLNRVATHLLRQFDQPRIVNIVAVAEKDLIV